MAALSEEQTLKILVNSNSESSPSHLWGGMTESGAIYLYLRNCMFCSFQSFTVNYLITNKG